MYLRAASFSRRCWKEWLSVAYMPTFGWIEAEAISFMCLKERASGRRVPAQVVVWAVLAGGRTERKQRRQREREKTYPPTKGAAHGIP